MNKNVLVGLGNPGELYKRNRHNLGFNVIEAICSTHKITLANKFNGKFTALELNSLQLLLFLPYSYMNNSGIPVQQLLSFFKLTSKNLIVIHDDIDLEVGRIKVKIGGSHAGHNGLKSIDEHIGREYMRLRFGVGHPGRRERVPDYVLSNFSKTEEEKVNFSIQIILDNLTLLLNNDIERFVSKCNVNNNN